MENKLKLKKKIEELEKALETVEISDLKLKAVNKWLFSQNYTVELMTSVRDTYIYEIYDFVDFFHSINYKKLLDIRKYLKEYEESFNDVIDTCIYEINEVLELLK